MTVGALFLVVLSSALHASWNASTQSNRSPTAFLFWMIAASCALLAPGLFWVELAEMTTRVWCWILVSGCVHAAYALFLGRAYERGDLSLVYPIARSTPAFVPLLAVPLLGERLTALGVLGIVIVVISLWLISSGGGPSSGGPAASGGLSLRRLLRPENAYAYWTLAATVAYSLTDTRVMLELDRLAWSGAMPRALFFFLIQASIQLPLFAWFARRALEGELQKSLLESWRTMLFAAIVSIVSYWLILEAMRRAPVSYIVAVRQCSVAFALLIAIVVLKERPSRLRWIGTFGTVLGIVLIGWASHG